jgi:hypothetical protein
MGRQKTPKEDEVARGISKIRNNPILSKVIIGAICLAAVVGFFVMVGNGIIKWDEVRRVFRREQKPQPPSAPEPKPLAPEPAAPKPPDADAPPKASTKPVQPSALVTSLQVKALRGPGTRVTLSVVMKNESRSESGFIRCKRPPSRETRPSLKPLKAPGTWEQERYSVLELGLT